MQIEFNREQYLTLMKLVYLGDWMANAYRTDDIIEAYEDVESYIFSFAKDFGFADYVDDEKVGDKNFYPTRKFEEETEVHELHAEYDNENFWDELVDRLAERDFEDKYGLEVIRKMRREERFEKLSECEDKWDNEVEKHGVDRLEIKDE